MCQNTRTGVTYTSMATARDEAQEGDTLKLLKNVGSFSHKGGKTLTLDLGGNTISTISVGPGFLIVKNGTITKQVDVFTSGTDEVYNSFTLAAGAEINVCEGYGIIVWQNSYGAENYGATVYVDGVITGIATLWVMGNIQTNLTIATNPVTVNVGSTAKMTNPYDD